MKLLSLNCHSTLRLNGSKQCSKLMVRSSMLRSSWTGDQQVKMLRFRRNGRFRRRKGRFDQLNGSQMDGKEILVKESDPAPPRSDHGGGNRGGGGFRPSFNSEATIAARQVVVVVAQDRIAGITIVLKRIATRTTTVRSAAMMMTRR